MRDMTSSRFHHGKNDESIRFSIGECSLGSILVAASEKGICAVSLGENPNALAKELQNRFSKAALSKHDHAFRRLAAKVIAFVEAPKVGIDLPLDVRGTTFQQRVWKTLQKIPLGSTRSYAEVAKRLGSPKSVRAVASACAANTIAVVIPCHRVVRTDGSLSGYRWGVQRKRALLDRELSKKRSRLIH